MCFSPGWVFHDWIGIHRPWSMPRKTCVASLDWHFHGSNARERVTYFMGLTTAPTMSSGSGVRPPWHPPQPPYLRRWARSPRDESCSLNQRLEALCWVQRRQQYHCILDEKAERSRRGQSRSTRLNGPVRNTEGLVRARTPAFRCWLRFFAMQNPRIVRVRRHSKDMGN